MNNNKVHSQRTVPFSWENKPGISKDSKKHGGQKDEYFPTIKLPPPPCQPEKSKAAAFHNDSKIPPPPCPNLQQQPLIRRSSSARRISFKKIMNDDPFLIAYKECTKSSTCGRKDEQKGYFSGGFGLKKNLSLFSCKHSSGNANNVADDSVVRVSQLPIMSKSPRD